MVSPGQRSFYAKKNTKVTKNPQFKDINYDEI